MRIKYTLLRLSLTSVLGMALLAGACSEQGTAPEQLSAPEQAAFAKGGKDQLSKLDLTLPAPMHVSAEVGAQGAVLRADQYFLLIPAGAVKEKTTFTMAVGMDGVVSLEAFATRANGSIVDVGAIGFRKKLTLALYYGGATQRISDPSALQVGWVQDNGALVPVPSTVDQAASLVYGELRHFSRYALAEPRDDSAGW